MPKTASGQTRSVSTSRTMSTTRAVFLDRDGVINPLLYHKDVGIVDSPFTLRQFRVFPHVPRAIRLLNDLGLLVIVVSNQPGIAKKHFSAATLDQFDKKLHSSLKRAGAHLDAIYYCLHHPDADVKRLRTPCTCRKPGVGLLLQAKNDFGVSLSQSYMVGDGLTDIEAGNRAGCSTIFIGRWKSEYSRFIRPPYLQPTFVAKDLSEAVQIIHADLPEKGFVEPRFRDTTAPSIATSSRSRPPRTRSNSR